MNYRRHFYFADTSDHLEAISEMEAHFPVTYVRSDADLDNVSQFSWDSVAEISGFGKSVAGDEYGDLRLLIMSTGEHPMPSYAYTNSKGERVFHYSQAANKRAIDFLVGGVFDGQAIVRSSMAVDVELDWGKAYLAALRSHCRKNAWRKVGSVFVSPGAVSLQRVGFRLTASVRASTSGDLRLVD